MEFGLVSLRRLFQSKKRPSRPNAIAWKVSRAHFHNIGRILKQHDAFRHRQWFSRGKIARIPASANPGSRAQGSPLVLAAREVCTGGESARSINQPAKNL